MSLSSIFHHVICPSTSGKVPDTAGKDLLNEITDCEKLQKLSLRQGQQSKASHPTNGLLCWRNEVDFQRIKILSLKAALKISVHIFITLTIQTMYVIPKWPKQLADLKSWIFNTLVKLELFKCRNPSGGYQQLAFSIPICSIIHAIIIGQEVFRNDIGRKEMTNRNLILPEYVRYWSDFIHEVKPSKCVYPPELNFVTFFPSHSLALPFSFSLQRSTVHSNPHYPSVFLPLATKYWLFTATSPLGN